MPLNTCRTACVTSCLRQSLFTCIKTRPTSVTLSLKTKVFNHCPVEFSNNNSNETHLNQLIELFRTARQVRGLCRSGVEELWFTAHISHPVVTPANNSTVNYTLHTWTNAWNSHKIKSVVRRSNIYKYIFVTYLYIFVIYTNMFRITHMSGWVTGSCQNPHFKRPFHFSCCVNFILANSSPNSSVVLNKWPNSLLIVLWMWIKILKLRLECVHFHDMTVNEL